MVAHDPKSDLPLSKCMYISDFLSPTFYFLLSYRSIVEFLYSFLVPSFSLPPQKDKPLHDVMMDILKNLNYPGTVSKSHFQTLGGPSWGNIVGVLHFLLQLAKSVVILETEETFKKRNFPDVDDGKFIFKCSFQTVFRGKSLLESWGTTFLPDLQTPLIFV